MKNISKRRSRRLFHKQREKELIRLWMSRMALLEPGDRNPISSFQRKFALVSWTKIHNSETQDKLQRIDNRLLSNNLLPKMAKVMGWKKYGHWHKAKRKTLIRIFKTNTGYEEVEPAVPRKYLKQKVRCKAKFT